MLSRRRDFGPAQATLSSAAGNKITGAFSPSPAPKQVDDATSLSTKVPSTPELWLAAARLHEQAGRLDQAEKAYLEAIRLNPKHLGALLSHARFRDRQNRGDEALWMYRELAHDFPKEASGFQRHRSPLCPTRKDRGSDCRIQPGD